MACDVSPKQERSRLPTVNGLTSLWLLFLELSPVGIILDLSSCKYKSTEQCVTLSRIVIVK